MRVGVEALCAMVLLSAGIFLCVEISWVGNGLKWWDTRPMARGVQGSVILVVACTFDMSVIDWCVHDDAGLHSRCFPLHGVVRTRSMSLTCRSAVHDLAAKFR